MLAFWFVGMALLGDSSSAIDYARDVKPIVAAKCLACHGGLKQEGNLRLDTAAGMKKGGDTGPAVMERDAAKSLLVARVVAADVSERMPPAESGAPLTADEVKLLSAWIEAGAPAPTDEVAEADPRAHWAFQVPQQTLVQRAVADGDESTIDVLLRQKQEKAGLSPQPQADRLTLLRRVTFDLVGLPPTDQERDLFMSDSSPDARERLVDRLLASPAHGERWARHWMDVWRYSDWWGLGAEVRNSQKHIWHWRDWIIDALNENVPYDEMVRQMLAADELYPTDEKRLRATGFLVRHYFKFNRNTWLDESVEHTAKAFLGLTINCAKCHDHKYDPFAQEDYYRLRAFFEPYQVRTDFVAGELDVEKNGLPRAFDMHAESPTYLFTQGDEARPRTDKSYAPGLPRLLEEIVGSPVISPVMLPPTAYQPGLRPAVLDDHLVVAEKELLAARAEVEVARAAFAQASAPADALRAQAKLLVATRALATAEAKGPALSARTLADRAKYGLERSTQLSLRAREAARLHGKFLACQADENLARAELELLEAPQDKQEPARAKVAAAREGLAQAQAKLSNPGEDYPSLEGSLKALESNLESEADRRRPFPSISTGRRSALAAWITSAKNPLAARVAVNQMWTRHLGAPLVETMFDFGRKLPAPLHQDVLDHLAVELTQRGHDMKHLHRLLVTSATYGRSSSSLDASTLSLEKDGDNKFLWRANPKRMEAQTIRDALLAHARDLDQTIGGPSVDCQQDLSYRRGLYFVHSHNDQNRFLGNFDDACVRECYRRSESIIPQQALALANGRLVLASSERVAEILLAEISTSDDLPLVREAFLRILGSEPTAEEIAACLSALAELKTLHADLAPAEQRKRALAGIAHALFNHNDFVTIR